MTFKRLLKPRFLFVYPLAVWLAVTARTSERMFLIGTMIVCLGEALRVWANAYVGHRKVNSTQKRRHDPKIGMLVTGGPYAYVRNPLYVGTFLIGLGFCVIVGNLLMSLSALGLFALTYTRKVQQEEALMREEIGEPCLAYHAAVPRWIPTWRRYPAARGQWSWQGIAASKEWKTVAWVIVCLIALYFREELWQEHRSFAAKHPVKHMLLASLLIGLIVADGTFELIRRTRRRAHYRTPMPPVLIALMVCLSGFAAGWLATPSAHAQPPRHDLKNGTEVYHYVNFPWGKYPAPGRSHAHAAIASSRNASIQFIYTFGMDFGACPLLDAKRVTQNPHILHDLDALAREGVEGIRWWIIPDGRNLTFDANRVPTGRGAGFRDDLWFVLDQLSARQMGVVFTLIDGNTWFKPEGQYQGAYFGHAQVIIDPGKRQAFYNTVVIPILQDLADWQTAHAAEPFPVSAIDLGNELWFGTDPYQGTGATMSHMQTYGREAVALVHHYLPDVPVTVGEADAERLVTYWTDAALGVMPGEGLDVYSFHHYGSEYLEGQHSLRTLYGLDQLGKRVDLQEYPGKNAPLGSPAAYLAPIGGTRSGRTSTGYLSGSWLWSVNGDDDATSDRPVKTLRMIADWLAAAFDQPDLVISNLRYPPTIKSGDHVQFELTLLNQGGVLAGSNRFELWLDGNLLAGVPAPALLAGERVGLTLPDPPWIATMAGTYELWSKADVWLQIQEADEDNNVVTATIVVSP